MPLTTQPPGMSTTPFQPPPVATTVPPQSPSTAATAPPQPSLAALVIPSQLPSPALASDEQAAAMADLQRTTSLLVDPVRKTQEHTNQTAATTNTDIDYMGTSR